MAWKRIVTASSLSGTAHNVTATDLLPDAEVLSADVLKVSADGLSLEWAPDIDTPYEHPAYTPIVINSATPSSDTAWNSADADYYCVSSTGVPVAGTIVDENECLCGTGGTWNSASSSCTPGTATNNVWVKAAKNVLATNEIISHVYYNLSSNSTGHIQDNAAFFIGKRTLTLNNLGYSGALNANNYSHHTGWDYTDDAGSITAVVDAFSGTNYAAFINPTPLNATFSGANVIDTLSIELRTTPEGHVAGFATSTTERTITLEDLGYTGASNADRYEYWTFSVTPDGGTEESHNVVSTHSAADAAVEDIKTLKIVGGTNMEVVASTDSDVTTVTFVGVANALGELDEINIGDGLQGYVMECVGFTADNATACVALGGTWEASSTTTTIINGITPNVTIDLVQGVDIAADIAGVPGAINTGHGHGVVSVSDASADADFGKLLHTSDSGGLTLKHLEVKGTLTTSGAGSVVLASTNLSIEDSVVQINMADASTYNASDSVLLFGNSDFTKGAKIINDASDNTLHFTDLNAADVANSGGGLLKGSNYKNILCGTLVAEDVTSTNVIATNGTFTGTVSAVELKLVGSLTSDVTSPAAGNVHWDGSDLWLYTT